MRVRFRLWLIPCDEEPFFIFREMEVPRIEIGMKIYNLVDFGSDLDPSEHIVESFSWDALKPDALEAYLGSADWKMEDAEDEKERDHAMRFWTREALLAGWYRNWTVEEES